MSVKNVREAAALNNVADRVEVVHGIVGPAVAVGGDCGDADRISPAELPACDVLELDCEGTEIDILKNLSIEPRTIIVESHGHLNSPRSDVRTTLSERGYAVISETIAEPDRRTQSVEQDIFVLVGLAEGLL